MSPNEWDPLKATDWWPFLEHEFDKPYWSTLWSRIHAEPRGRVFPPEGDVFRALLHTSFADTKVVILGQDPYPGEGQAHGLCFSVPCGIDTPESLANIHTELEKDVGVTPSEHGNLEAWADQGVLLLNTILTVRAGEPGAHEGWGWENFTSRIISAISNEKAERVVFMLWGEKAQRKSKLINDYRNTVICSSHPSRKAARRGCNPFLGSRPFSRANRALDEAGLQPISWTLPDYP